MERPAVELEKVIKAWGLTLSVRKTKLVAGALGTEDEAKPIMLEGGEVECVTNFKYLGSVHVGGKWRSGHGGWGENCHGSKSFWGP